MHDSTASPLETLKAWMRDASEAGVAEPREVAFITAAADARPTARTVSLKRIQDDALLFTSAMWTRKAREIRENPHVALLFYWPAIGRQVHVTGRAVFAERELAVELFSERNLPNQLQTIVSRQGETIESTDPLRARHAHLMKTLERPPECPPDWGAIRVLPETVELWVEEPDRIHERRLYERDAGGWRWKLLAP